VLGCLLLAGALVGGGSGVAANQADSDAAWATIRAKVPAEQSVYRPTWLPDRFRQPGQAVDSGLEFGVVYVSDEGDRLLFGQTGNACGLPAGDTSQRVEAILVHGLRGELVTNTRPDCFPRIAVGWVEAGHSHSIQGNEVTRSSAASREEMLHIVAGLAAVTPSGAPVPTSPLNGRPDVACFRETLQCMAGPFRAYWEAHGGLALNGYPLTGEMLEQLEDGRIYQVQYFERVRLEWHPEHVDTPYEVLLGQFGRRILAGVPGAPAAPVPPQDGSTHFPVTGHNVGPRFLAHWEAHGGLAQFGYPLTELFAERLEDGNTYQVQYFERARFELHPENAAANDVLLGQFGRRILGAGTQTP
jgi:hypothetical protein